VGPLYGRIKADLGRSGRVLDDADLLIGAIALPSNGTLVTSNTRHFGAIPGLRIENWREWGGPVTPWSGSPRPGPPSSSRRAWLHFRDEEALLAAAPDPQAYKDTVLCPEKVALNLEYLDHWSPRRDLRCILDTILSRPAR
jgi:hypothetical protein